MKFAKEINLTAYHVSFVDTRQPKPRAEQRETVILDGGRISALHRLGQRPAGYLTRQYEAAGYAVTGITHGETMTATVDLETLWARTATAKNGGMARLMADLACQETEEGGAAQ